LKTEDEVMLRMMAMGTVLLLASVCGGQEQTWIEVLKSDAPTAAKAAACRALKTVGSAESVAAIAPLLSDAALSHEARIALEPMPWAEAAAALRNAVPTTDGVLRAGILDSIGERRDPEAVAVAAAVLADDDLRVVTSAALALGKIGTSEAARQLEQAYATAPAERRAAIGDGLIRCAVSLHQAGHSDEAAAVFRRLSSPDQPAAVRSAALLGLVNTAGDKMPETIRSFLADDDPLVRAAAAASLPYLPQAALQAIVADLDRLPVASRPLVLTAIRLRGDRALAAAAVTAARSENPEVARAGIEAAGVLAGADALDVLLPIAVGGGPLAGQAWRAVETLRGDDVDAKLTATLPVQTDAGIRVRLIQALVARNAADSVPVLLGDARSENADVRAASIDAIFRLATPEHVPAIVRLMLQTGKGAQRDTLEKAVMLALEAMPDADQRTAAVLAGADLRSDAQRIEFLPLLGRIGGARALDLVQSGLNDPNAEIYDAGVRAIANWPDAGVVEQLAELARTARENHQRIWALRAMIRVSALPGGLPDDRKLALLKQAMEMAARDDERSLALQRAGAVRTADSLQFAVSYLDHPGMSPDACRAVVELAHYKELRDPNRDAFVAALKRVLALTSDQGLKDRAERYLADLGPGP
jgi:HEAT repeat protein